jgi:hypothetical protein
MEVGNVAVWKVVHDLNLTRQFPIIGLPIGQWNSVPASALLLR